MLTKEELIDTDKSNDKIPEPIKPMPIDTGVNNARILRVINENESKNNNSMNEHDLYIPIFSTSFILNIHVRNKQYCKNNNKYYHHHCHCDT
jgi:hypothetical protein